MTLRVNHGRAGWLAWIDGISGTSQGATEAEVLVALRAHLIAVHAKLVDLIDKRLQNLSKTPP
jgi:hypothetical protein